MNAMPEFHRVTSPAKRVLIVEDDRDMREVLVDLFALEGYRVSAAANGRQALKEARRHPPDVILLDLMMPVMTGWQFRAEQSRDPGLALVPVVVMSGFGDGLDVAAVLPKPFVLDDVLSTVRRLAA